MSDLAERLRAIGEEEMYQAPATTKATIDKAAEELERLYARVAELEGALRGIAGAIRIGGEVELRACAPQAGEGDAARSILGPHQLRSTR